MDAQPLYSASELHQLREEAKAAADRNFAEITNKHPWLETMENDLVKILLANASIKSKHQMLRALADRVNAAVLPNSACIAGCSHCCHISVTVTSFEADLIGEFTGRKPVTFKQSLQHNGEASDAYYGKPCTFLKEGRCSIYEVRPLSCRLHHSLGASPTLCDTRVEVMETVVPSLDLTSFWQAHAKLMEKYTFADIRDYFPES